MLSINNRPGYFIYCDIIRTRICYATHYSIMGQILAGEYIDSEVEVNFIDYCKLINKYKCHNEMFDLQNKMCTMNILFDRCNLPYHIRNDIRQLTYFDWDITMWDITELIKKHGINKSEIENIVIVEKKSPNIIQRILNITNADFDCIILKNNITVDVCNKIFKLLELDV